MSDVTAVSAETVLGNDDAKESTVARRAAVSSWEGAGSSGVGDWKKVGCVRSGIRSVSSHTSHQAIGTGASTDGRRTELEDVGVYAEAGDEGREAALEVGE